MAGLMPRETHAAVAAPTSHRKTGALGADALHTLVIWGRLRKYRVSTSLRKGDPQAIPFPPQLTTYPQALIADSR